MKSLPIVAAYAVTPQGMTAIITDENSDLAAFLKMEPKAFKFTSKEAADKSWWATKDKIEGDGLRHI